MGKTTKPTAARLKEILKRQDPPAWGRDYAPSIRATREEAPSRSRPSQIWSELLQRHIHVLSDPEKFACLMALFHPGLFELQEQRMLHYLPSPHPLYSHPNGAGVMCPALRGTLDIADALGFLDHHAQVNYPTEESGQSTPSMMPFPWVGDLLLFMEDGCGPYCLNWTVKNEATEFTGEKPKGIGKNSERAIAKAKARHAIEAVYYQDGGIPTLQITRESFDGDLIANLGQLILWSNRNHSLSEQAVNDIIGYTKAAVGTTTPALELLFYLARLNNCELYEIKIVLHQAIWRRQLRIDLFKPFHIDKPLLAEARDPLDVYGRYFARA